MVGNRKTFLIIGLLILMICLCACSEMDNTEDILPDYISFDQLPEGYEVKNAVEDDCVVFVDSKLISGEDVWKAFLAKAEKRQSCRVRVACYYGEENIFCLNDLSYEDASFRIHTSEGISREYKYLNHYEIDIENSEADEAVMDCYILVDQENATYDDIEKTMAASSPVFADAIDFYIVCINIDES